MTQRPFFYIYGAIVKLGVKNRRFNFRKDKMVRKQINMQTLALQTSTPTLSLSRSDKEHLAVLQKAARIRTKTAMFNHTN